MDRQVRTRRVGRPDDLLAGDGDLCALAVHRLCLHLPGDQEPARARTGQCPTRSERDDRRTWHEGERMSDTAVAAATTDPDPIGNVSTQPAHLPGDSRLWSFVIGDMFLFASYLALHQVYRVPHPDLFLQRQ